MTPSSTTTTYATTSGDGFLSFGGDTSSIYTSIYTTKYPTPNGGGYLSTGSTSTTDPLPTGGGVLSGVTSAPTGSLIGSITPGSAPELGFLTTGDSAAPTPAPGSDGAGNSDSSSTLQAGFISTTPMAQAPTPGVVVGNDKTSIENLLDPTITTSGPAAPVVVLVDGKTSTVPSGERATGANGAPLPILTDVGGKIQTITPSQVFTVVNGQTFSAIATPILTVVDGQTVTAIPSPILTVINGHTTFTAIPTPIVTEISGHAVIIVPTTNGGYVPDPNYLLFSVSPSFPDVTYIPSPPISILFSCNTSLLTSISGERILALVFVVPRFCLLNILRNGGHYLRCLSSLCSKVNLRTIH
jgi:hypothetical protein